MGMKLTIRTFLRWLPLGVAITLVCLLLYAAVQQSYRQGLNDPQVQMAEDAAYALSQGEVPAGVVPRGALIDMRQSLQPWIAVYDSAGKGLEASGQLDGAPPAPPQGVLQAAYEGKGKYSPNPDEDRVTWQAASGVREAIVAIAVPGASGPKYYVVAGRAMREVEAREGQLTRMVAVGWLAAMLASFAAALFATWVRKRSQPHA